VTQPIFEKFTAGIKRAVFTDTAKIDCKTGVSTESVKKVLSVLASPTITDYSAVKDNLKYTAKVCFFVVYTDGDGVVRKTECANTVEGAIAINGLEEGEKIRLSSKVEKAQPDLNGLNLNLNAVLSVTAVKRDKVVINTLTGGEGLYYCEEERRVEKDFGERDGEYRIEEEFEIDGEVQEVLSHGAKVAISATQCGVGSVIVDGQIFLTVIALQKSQRCSIIKETRTLPFRMEIEHPDAMPTMSAFAFATERSVKTEVLVDQETGKSTVKASLSIGFTGCAYSTDTVSFATDAFSVEKHIALEKSVSEYYLRKEMRTVTEPQVLRASVENLPIGTTVLAVGAENLEIIEVQANGCGATLTGEYSCTAYLSDAEGELITMRLSAPIEKKFENLFADGDGVAECKAVVEKGVARIVSATEMEVETQIILTVYPEERAQASFVSDLSVTGDKESNPHAISVYIPEEGEELWSLAKRLNTCPQALVETNPELTFPLTGKERIVVYRQK